MDVVYKVGFWFMTSLVACTPWSVSRLCARVLVQCQLTYFVQL